MRRGNLPIIKVRLPRRHAPRCCHSITMRNAWLDPFDEKTEFLFSRNPIDFVNFEGLWAYPSTAYRWRWDYIGVVPEGSLVPSKLWDRVELSFGKSGFGIPISRDFIGQTAAKKALSNAYVNYGRSLAGLPELTFPDPNTEVNDGAV